MAQGPDNQQSAVAPISQVGARAWHLAGRAALPWRWAAGLSERPAIGLGPRLAGAGPLARFAMRRLAFDAPDLALLRRFEQFATGGHQSARPARRRTVERAASATIAPDDPPSVPAAASAARVPLLRGAPALPRDVVAELAEEVGPLAPQAGVPSPLSPARRSRGDGQQAHLDPLSPATFVAPLLARAAPPQAARAAQRAQASLSQRAALNAQDDRRPQPEAQPELERRAHAGAVPTLRAALLQPPGLAGQPEQGRAQDVPAPHAGSHQSLPLAQGLLSRMQERQPGDASPRPPLYQAPAFDHEASGESELRPQAGAPATRGAAPDANEPYQPRPLLTPLAARAAELAPAQAADGARAGHGQPGRAPAVRPIRDREGLPLSAQASIVAPLLARVALPQAARAARRAQNRSSEQVAAAQSMEHTQVEAQPAFAPRAGATGAPPLLAARVQPSGATGRPEQQGLSFADEQPARAEFRTFAESTEAGPSGRHAWAPAGDAQPAPAGQTRQGEPSAIRVLPGQVALAPRTPATIVAPLLARAAPPQAARAAERAAASLRAASEITRVARRPEQTALAPQQAVLSPQQAALTPQPAAPTPEQAALTPQLQRTTLTPQPPALTPQRDSLTPQLQRTTLAPQRPTLTPQPATPTPQQAAHTAQLQRTTLAPQSPATLRRPLRLADPSAPPAPGTHADTHEPVAGRASPAAPAQRAWQGQAQALRPLHEPRSHELVPASSPATFVAPMIARATVTRGPQATPSETEAEAPPPLAGAGAPSTAQLLRELRGARGEPAGAPAAIGEPMGAPAARPAAVSRAPAFDLLRPTATPAPTPAPDAAVTPPAPQRAGRGAQALVSRAVAIDELEVSAEQAPAQQAPELDIEAIAQKVYEHLRRRLRIDQERLGRH